MRRSRLALWVAVGAVLVTVELCHAALTPEAVAQIKDAVVLIRVDLEVTATGDAAGGSGSGFVISDDGLIVTNAHVVAPEIEQEDGRTTVADQRTVTVIFHPNEPREQRFEADVLRENPELDLALLRVAKSTPAYLELADSDMVYETQPVYVCGHPLGLREISIRSGAIAARRTWGGSKYIEHDAAAEGGNSGGPLVDDQSRVVGVHTLTIAASSMLTKFAIPSNVVDIWLKSAPAQDPVRESPGSHVLDILAASGLHYTDEGDGLFSLAYAGDVTVYIHEYQDFLRGYVYLGYLPGDNLAEQGEAALAALRLNYNDLAGRLSVFETDDGEYELYWEFQAPLSAATPVFTFFMGQLGAQRAAYWEAFMEDSDAEAPAELQLPGGDDELFELLGGLLEQTGLYYTRNDDFGLYDLPYENGEDLEVSMSVLSGTAWTFLYLGGMPGDNEREQGQIAIELLQRNWDDPFGRLSLDWDLDLVWESQVPVTFLTPDYLTIIANTCASQAISFWEEYGHTPFNG